MDTSQRSSDPSASLVSMWRLASGTSWPDVSLTITGDRHVLHAAFDVTSFATHAVTCANVALALLAAARRDNAAAAITVDRRAAAAAFSAERLSQPIGWTLPSPWDPLAGDYRSADGWVRLHTNYEAHRRAALRTLGVPGATARDEVAAIVARAHADDIEAAVVEAGGCAATMRSVQQWRAHPASGYGTGTAPDAIEREAQRHNTTPRWSERVDPAASCQPLAGLRVLDLTRVMAGPVATRFLAAHGADVLRIDPPGFEEVPALVPEMTQGKRCTALDLTRADHRARFESLVAEADVVVSGLRPGALDALGYGTDGVAMINPNCLDVRLSAYGRRGPWAGRRGFDSLVQMSTGIADTGRRGDADRAPVPLPVQALDHGAGFLIATAILSELLAQLRGDSVHNVAASLVGTAELVLRSPTSDDHGGADPTWDDADTVISDTWWGPLRQAPMPVAVAGLTPCFRYDRIAAPLASAAPTW